MIHLYTVRFVEIGFPDGNPRVIGRLNAFCFVEFLLLWNRAIDSVCRVGFVDVHQHCRFIDRPGVTAGWLSG